jgi:hypothetical protein
VFPFSVDSGSMTGGKEEGLIGEEKNVPMNN